FGDRVRHIHLSDNAGKGWDSHLPPGEGVLPLDAFLRDLAASGYDRTISLEVDLRRYLTEPARLREVLVGMRERVEALLEPAGS
ncbi:MAG: sugar phosphate isomerase/epimerase family protein, partial [Actinomycetota bacterium]